MLRKIWKPALALGAVLAATGAAGAGDRDTVLLSGSAGSATMTLGGTGTAAKAATEDNELARGYHGGGFHGGFGGYHGGYGGYRGGYYGGYRGYGYGGYRGYGYGGYRGFYRPYYAGYYRPYYGYGYGYGLGGLGLGYGLGYGGYGLGYSSYSTYYSSYPAYYSCGYLGIGGTGTGAPVVNLGTTSFAQPVVPNPMPQPATPGDGTFPYDGGPSSPVPLPKADPGAIPPANPSSTATDLPVSGKSRSLVTPVVSPYKYKAYGEK
jgi:hypothetical protein